MIVPAPHWVSYPDMVIACNGISVSVACTEDESFKLTAPKLEAAITTRAPTEPARSLGISNSWNL